MFAVHALYAGPDTQGFQLLVDDVLEGLPEQTGLAEQIDAMFQVVAARAFSKVVECVQTEISLMQIMQSQGITHLQVEEEMIIRFFIAPAMGGFEDLQSNQPVHRRILSEG